MFGELLASGRRETSKKLILGKNATWGVVPGNNRRPRADKGVRGFQKEKWIDLEANQVTGEK